MRTVRAMGDAQGFSTEVRRQNGAVVIELHGELDDHTASRLRATLDEVGVQGGTTLALDLRHMTFIDSTGLGAIVGALKRTRPHGGDVILRDPSAATRKVLELTGLDRVFTIVDGQDAPAQSR